MLRISLFGIICLPAVAQTTLQVCDPNTLEPLEITEVMTGTTVSLLVSSDANSIWSGGIFLRNEDRLMGTLSARGKDSDSRDWTQSHLTNAGPAAKVTQWKDSYISGFDLYTDELIPQPGRWFVLDYTALESGPCTIEFYRYRDDDRDSWILPDPNTSFTLTNSPTRDFDHNQGVNFYDFVLFSQYWQQEECIDSMFCPQADLNQDGTIGLLDLIAFSDFWLWGSPNWKPAPPQNQNQIPDSGTVFWLMDSSEQSSLTLSVGETATIYLHKTTDLNPVLLISVEVTISDPNLGWIDNTPYDPDNPLNSDTTQILAEPRYTLFDDWSPGYTQYEGIYFLIAGLSEPLPDGAMALFQYTATSPGRVTLNLIDYIQDNATLLPIEIEQIIPAAVQSQSLDNEGANTTSSVDMLNQIYEEDEELQQSIDEKSWDEFIQQVEEAEETEGIN